MINTDSHKATSSRTSRSPIRKGPDKTASSTQHASTDSISLGQSGLCDNILSITKLARSLGKSGSIVSNGNFARPIKPSGMSFGKPDFLQSGEIKAGTAPSQFRAPRSKELQLDLVDKVYHKTAEARMAKGKSEQICLWYAKDIYNGLMDQKEAGKLPDFTPRIYGWEKPADAQFGEAGKRLGKAEAKNYAHNLVVLEDKEGNPVKVLDPWQTGTMWNDSVTTFDSIKEYKDAREGGIGGLSGELVRWPGEDELHARRNR